MRVLILGKGYIGTNLYKGLSGDFDVSCLSKQDALYTDENVLLSLLQDGDYKYIINAQGFSGYQNIDDVEDNKQLCWEYNVKVPLMMANVINKLGLQMLHISSGCIYNGYDKRFLESDMPNFGMFNSNSSFYSKMKHVAELLLPSNIPLFRIRMPFCSEPNSRNYIIKLLKYDNLINESNSITCVNDFVELTKQWIHNNISGKEVPFGPIHCVNPGEVRAKDIVSMLRSLGVTNPKHNFIELNELKTKAPRSNCVLDSVILQKYNLSMPPAFDSLKLAINSLSRNISNMDNGK